VFNNYGWTYWVYFFVSEAVAFILAGLVIARWFVPKESVAAPAHAPAETHPES